MKMTTFAAIDIGSYEIEMKIFELSAKYGMREIDNVRHRMNLGKEVYRNGKLSYETMDALCEVLSGFTDIMGGYHTDACRVCATSAFRELGTPLILLDRIKIRTGLQVEILSNSEQRFLSYKSIASKESAFNKIIQKGTAIVDVGGGSIQISLFNKDKLVTTQNIRAGSLRIRERLEDLKNETSHLEKLVEELINNEFLSFKKLHLKDHKIQNLIMVGDYMTELVKGNTTFTREAFFMLYDEIVSKEPSRAAEEYGIPVEQASFLLPSVIIFKRIMEQMGVEMVWSPGLDLCDGIAYDYAEKNKYIKVQHNFEYDILASARNIAKRYQCNKAHYANVEDLALTIFDSLKKVHGMGKRDRLLLQIACILHGCGKYISLSQVADCSYNIIRATEIIGLSHSEREIIANVVKYNTAEITYQELAAANFVFTRKQIVLIEKLTAILRVANALDRSHRQKFGNVKTSLREKHLVITVDTVDDITLERGLFEEKAVFFEEVFNVKVFIKQKKFIHR